MMTPWVRETGPEKISRGILFHQAERGGSAF